MSPHQRESKSKNDADSIIEMQESRRPSSPLPTSQYGYLEHIQSFKSLCRFNDKSLPRKVR